MAPKFYNLIDGKWIDAKCGKRFKNINPADPQDIVGTFPDSRGEDVDAAVEAARKAYERWRLVPAPKRGEIIFQAGRLLKERKEKIAQLMTREMGKILKETRGDIQEGIDTADLAGSEGRRLFGQTAPSELPDKFCISMRMPIGVCGMITPWNFPIAIPTWKIFPALVCGNTVVFKPASDTPASAVRLVEILVEAGVPKGVVNLVHGTGRNVGAPLVGHPGVNVISFTGSSGVGRQIAATCGQGLKRVSLELGGKNAQMVMADADLDLAAEGVLWGAFGTTGQRCTATSRLILHQAIKDALLDKLLKRVRKIKIGNGLDESVEMGPLINEGQRKIVHDYVQIGQKEGAKLLIGGNFYQQGECEKGFFYAPTIFDGVKPGMRIAQEEIFGPVLSVLTVKSFEEAVKVHNGVAYGLSSSIYTQDVNLASRAIRDLEAGITYINGPTIGAEVSLPFGGVKDTGNGHRESGTTVYDMFTEWKSVYIDFSGKLQKAQIDT
ncbi:MAG TPA: aldehyde dehydrogenase family protein [Firmicutes bacterium]|nr:aldehyde dehydrogenase family protein [Bacillota bacterium]